MALLGYARVSTAQQTGGVDRQADDLRAAGCTRIWTDVGVSGARMDRPELAALLDYAREGDTIVVTELSRIGRTMRGVVTLVEDLAARGIGVRSLTQGIDTSPGAGPMGKVILALCAALAEVERDILIERTRSGLAAARARGRVGGRPIAVSPEQVTAARTLVASGHSVVAAARTLGVARSSLYRALERERTTVEVP
ncbi:MAG: recombinase family protein [Cellulomonas sp.]|uniref:recombinase family protein n=1 Tax=Cellulomonas sp. TaxID=40001 RepID=UPI002586A66F|nr:recombinase family protein [Cellulomonas sp.]MCR6706609.1 recombinase family protein [Cellulomonas sp.]